MTESVTLQSDAIRIAGFANKLDNEEESEHSNGGDEGLSTGMELKFHAQRRAIVERNRDLCESGKKAFRICQRRLRPDKVANLKLLTMLDHFLRKQSGVAVAPTWGIPRLSA